MHGRMREAVAEVPTAGVHKEAPRSTTVAANHNSASLAKAAPCHIAIYSAVWTRSLLGGYTPA